MTFYISQTKQFRDITMMYEEHNIAKILIDNFQKNVRDIL